MLLYITVMIKPVFPVVSDWWQHEFNNIEHLSCVHLAYGSHHVQKEVADTNPEQGKNQSGLKSEDQVPFHLNTVACKFNFSAIKNTNWHIAFQSNNLSSVLLSNPSPPPKFS